MGMVDTGLPVQSVPSTVFSGDGFLEHNFFGLLEGLETEITDKVVLRIMEKGLWLSAQLLRHFTLMYGKRPNIREIIKTLVSN